MAAQPYEFPIQAITNTPAFQPKHIFREFDEGIPSIWSPCIVKSMLEIVAIEMSFRRHLHCSSPE
jgi:hypothetical protein